MIVEPRPDPRTGLAESPYRAEDVALVPGASEALRQAREAGAALVVASNQPSAAKGTASLQQLHAVHERAAALLAGQGVQLDAWRYCFHHPQGTVPELTRECPCRKPAPGLLLDAARDLGLDLSRSWMVGDSDTDVAAGRRAGCRTVLVEHPATAHRRSGAVDPTLRVFDLALAMRALPSYLGGVAERSTDQDA